MYPLVVTLLAALLSALPAAAQDYTVWASVIFSRSGEHTPEVLADFPTLTSLGASQVHSSGAFFRNRYITSPRSSSSSAPLQDLAANVVNGEQTYVIALDEQWIVASAQAFLQGLYPPFTLSSSSGSSTNYDPTSILANGTYVEYPLQGYQYVQIHAADGEDPAFPYIAGSLDCPAFNLAALNYAMTPSFLATQNQSKPVYDAVGPSVLSTVLGPDAWDYSNAYAIYDFLNYENAHNSTVAGQLSHSAFQDPNTNLSYFDMLRYYTDQQQYAELGNMSAYNNLTSNTTLPYGTPGSISTIAGNFLAAKMLSQLQIAIEFGEIGASAFKLSLLFGDFEPLLSLFALTGLTSLDSNFYGLPAFGSAAVLELFSYANSSAAATSPFPQTSNLFVQFLFRNGTDAAAPLQAYPLFNRGPSQTQMSWADFDAAMTEIALGDVGDWCLQCGASNLFCAAWNSSDGINGSSASSSTSSASNSGSHNSKSHSLSPTAAGAIGAVVTLVVAGLLFAALMLLGGLRVHRVERRRRGRQSELGGFKGSQKLASDRDLALPKGGAVVGASIERRGPMSPDAGVHERVGSWELGKQGKELHVSNLDGAAQRPSLEDEMHVNPFQEPVKASERV